MSDPIVRSGDLRHRVTIQERTYEYNEARDRVEAWTDVVSVWAFVRPASSKEAIIANQLKAQIYHSVTMRWPGSTAITPQMRIKFGDRILNITQVMNRDSRNYLLDILATEVIA